MTHKDWIRPMCKVWGEQKAALWPCDGPNGLSFLALRSKVRSAKVPLTEFSVEGFTIENALRGMDERPRLVLHLHYLCRPSRGKSVSQELGISEAQYWHELDVAFAYLAGRIHSEASEVIET
jgi:hypothetical protein